MQPVKLAIVGCGRITEDSHLPAALRSPAIELSALIDGNVERAQRLARMYGFDGAIGAELEPVLKSVECVLIATPNDTHFPLASAALQRGLPVLIEKPLTVTYAEARRLCDTARSSGTFISVGFHTRQYPVVQLVSKLLKKGWFGRIRNFHFEYGTRGGWAPHSGYNLRRNQSGGGVLVVNGTHFIDRMIFWFGIPTSFQYFDDSYGGVEANCHATLQYSDGVTGSLRFSKTIDLRNHFQMETDRYRIQIPSSEREHIRLWAHDAPDIEMTVRDALRLAPADCFQVQLEEFARAARGYGSPTVDGDTGALSVKLCEDLYANREQLAEPWLLTRQAGNFAA